ncbi:MAG TPA: Hsp70 family protein [Gemmataceae bacterium]|jgi:molecular chaperone HscC|nr:Hsp70 family protein [Gemmataceae bacterium]
MSKIVGIDLGTTNSAVAYLTAKGPEIIPNALGESLTPSVVGIDLDGNVIVGRTARELAVLHPERTAAVFKRKMGLDWKTDVAGKSFTAEELSSLVLRSLKEDAEAHFKEPVRRAVITVPAYFNDRQRKATLNAGRIAGLEVDRILNEPTAAALAYGFHEAKEEKTLLIFDLGGGTFDVSVVEIFDGVIEVKASSGETFLGGEDFTRNLTARILDACGVRFEQAEMMTPKRVSRLLQQCEIAKRKLSRLETVEVAVPDNNGEIDEKSRKIPVTRVEFANWTDKLLARLDGPLRRALGDARLTRDQIAEVLLVGGATRMPNVALKVRDWFGKPPQCRLNPDEVVALGAAVQAGLHAQHQSVDDIVVTDVAPFTLGIETSKRLGSELREGYFLPVLHRNTAIPASRVQTIETVFPNQTEMVVKIFQGEGRKTTENLRLGEFRVTDIPRGPAGQPVDVRFTYDLNGVLEVEATVQQTQRTFNHVVTQYAQGMTKAQIDRAIREMAALKTHPRDEAINRHLLRRCERLYKELPQVLREQLGMLLDGFEMSLADQDPAEVASNRQALEIFLSQFDPEGRADSEEDADGDVR